MASTNLYLSPLDTWVAAISESGEGAELRVNDESCLLAESDDGSVESVTHIRLPERSGYIVVVEMADVDMGPDRDVSLLEQTGAITGQQDCTGLAERWTSGPWSDSTDAGLTVGQESITAGISLISVERGTMYEIPATVLAQFSDIVQHTRPGAGEPNLATPHDAQSDTDGTMARVCAQSTCIEARFDWPALATTMALFASEFQMDFSIESAIGASTEAVMLNPLFPHLAGAGENEGLAFPPYPVLDYAVSKRDGGVLRGSGTSFSLANEILTADDEETGYNELLASVTQISLDFVEPSGSTLFVPVTSILKLPGTRALALTSGATVGQLILGLNNNASFITAVDDRTFRVSATMLVVLQEFVNGTLTGPDGQSVRSSYGRSYDARQGVDLDFMTPD